METPPSKTILSKALLAETIHLQAAWQRHEASVLDTYLIQDVEDPRINIQSILSRHFLIRELFGQRYALVMEHEIYFSLIVNWLLSLYRGKRSRSAIHWQLNEILDDLLTANETGVSAAAPSFIADAFGRLVFPNYVSDLLMWIPRDDDEELIPDYLLNTFQRIWAEILESEQASPVSVLEAGCGSANDYRFLAYYGLSRFLRYTGFDLAEKNISNAKQRFPDTDFRVASVFDIPAEDRTYDYFFVHDLFEHLSEEGMERAILEIKRVTAKKACFHFFNMSDAQADEIRWDDNYYWNRLSCQTMSKRLELLASRIDHRHIDSWLNDSFAYSHYHNKYAYSWCLYYGRQDAAEIKENWLDYSN